MNNTTCIIIIVIIFLILIFVIVNCNKNKLDYCDTENAVENFNENLIKNGSKRKILKDKLRKEFVNSGRNSVSFLYNSLKTPNAKQLFRRGPNLRLTPEQIQDIINSLKADNTNNPTNNDASSSQTYVQIACSAYDTLKPFLEKVPWQLLSQIYGDAGGLGSDNPQTRINAEKSIGLDLLNYGLGLAGLGFLAGPFANFLGLSKKTVPDPPLAVVLAKIVSDTAIYTSITTFMESQNGYFNAVNNFIIDYTENKKYNQQIVCPYPMGCQTEGSGSAKKCDPNAQILGTISCMRHPFSQDPTIRYDPNILYSTMPSEFETNSNDSSITKRAYLKQILKDPSGALCALVTGSTSSPAAISAGIPAMMILLGNVQQNGPPGSALGVCIGFLPQFLIIISYTIAYYHELSLLDETVLSGQPGYRNPWITSAIGDTTCLWNFFGDNKFNGNALPQTSTNLLGKLQDICKKFQNYIDTTFEIYFNGLTVVDNQYRDNGCCPGGCCHIPNPRGGGCYSQKIKCKSWHIFHITDSANSGSHPVIPNDPTAPNNTKDWYGAMRAKYPSYSFYSPDTNEVTITDSLNGGIALVAYMNCFREFLNFPYNHLLDYCKMAGYEVPSNITGDQLYYNTLNRLLPLKGYTNPQQYGIPVSIPFVLNNMDLSGGYPFGLKSPSYRQAIQKWLTPNAIVLSDSSSLLQDTYEFNTYCSPIINVQPIQMYDATAFNIEGDDASQKWDHAACNGIPDSSNHTVGMVSCLKGGLFPGTSNNIIPNSRTAFCVDISGSGSTYKARASPLIQKMEKIDVIIFRATGTNQSFVVPAGVSLVTFYTWGGGGGSGFALNRRTGNIVYSQGGSGGFQSGYFNVQQNDILNIMVGQAGQNSSDTSAYGGGGVGGFSFIPQYNPYNIQGGSGGGRSAISLNGTEIISTGGGGGGSCVLQNDTLTITFYAGGFAGHAGFSNSDSTATGLTICGQGATSSSGGSGAIPDGKNINNPGQSGIKYSGANADNNGADSGAGAGGGGAYGGGAGGSFSASGGVDGAGGTSGGGGSTTYFSDVVTSINIDNGSSIMPGGYQNPNYISGIGVGGSTNTGGTAGNGLVVLVFFGIIQN